MRPKLSKHLSAVVWAATALWKRLSRWPFQLLPIPIFCSTLMNTGINLPHWFPFWGWCSPRQLEVLVDHSTELWPLKSVLPSPKPTLSTPMGLGNEWMNEWKSCFLLMALPVDHSENIRQLKILCSLGLLWHISFNFSVSIFLNSPLPCPDAWQYLSARFWAEWQNVPVGSLPQLSMWSGCSLLHPSHQLTPVRRRNN